MSSNILIENSQDSMLIKKRIGGQSGVSCCVMASVTEYPESRLMWEVKWKAIPNRNTDASNLTNFEST